MDDYESASKRRERDAKPNDFGAQLAYALSLDRNGRAKDADREFGNALRIDPTNTTLRELVAKRCPMEYTAIIYTEGTIVEPRRTTEIDLRKIAREQAGLLSTVAIQDVLYDSAGLHILAESATKTKNDDLKMKGAELIIGEQCSSIPLSHFNISVSHPQRKKIGYINDTYNIMVGTQRIPVPAGYGRLIFVKDRRYYMSAPVNDATFQLVSRGATDENSTLVSPRAAQEVIFYGSQVLLNNHPGEFVNATTNTPVPSRDVGSRYGYRAPESFYTSNRADSIDDLFLTWSYEHFGAAEVPLNIVEKLSSLAQQPKTEEQPTTTYSPQKTHYLQTQINHPQFGLGVVVSANATKIECDFGKNGIKKLAHNLKK